MLNTSVLINVLFNFSVSVDHTVDMEEEPTESPGALNTGVVTIALVASAATLLVAVDVITLVPWIKHCIVALRR